MSDPKDIIIEAIHSAFVKYPKEDDPASHDHWISPADSAIGSTMAFGAVVRKP